MLRMPPATAPTPVQEVEAVIAREVTQKDALETFTMAFIFSRSSLVQYCGLRSPVSTVGRTRNSSSYPPALVEKKSCETP